jgi:soluble lytic murein transglycosylase-like protein
MYMYIDENGVPVVTDRPHDRRAVQYEVGDFEAIALGQKGVAHRARASADARAPLAPAHVRQLVDRASTKHAVPPALLLAVIGAESAFDPRAVSRAGAQGLMQLMPATARDMGVVDAFDPEQNVLGGARYLAFLLKHFGDEELAIAAYNAGPGRVTRAGNQVPDIPETRAYVATVLGLYAAYRATNTGADVGAANAPFGGVSR